MSYAATTYMLPTATADDDGPEFDAAECGMCVETLQASLTGCFGEFDEDDGDISVNALQSCVDQALEAYEECADACELDD